VLPLIQHNWGFTHAVDQQVGGLLMWVPACLIYTCGILGLLARWYAPAAATMSPPVGEPKPAAS
jgi:putative membrane protein